MRDDKAMTRTTYFDVHYGTSRKLSQEIVKQMRKKIKGVLHDLCGMNYIIRNVENADSSCFYWSLIVALQLLPHGSLYDQIEVNPTEDTLQLIRNIRHQIHHWWLNQDKTNLYDPQRCWMMTRSEYVTYVLMKTCSQLSEDYNAMRTMIEKYASLFRITSFDDATTHILVQRMRHLLNTTLRTEVYANQNEADMIVEDRRSAYYEWMCEWYFKYAENELFHCAADINNDQFKSIVARILWKKIETEYKELNMFEYGSSESKGIRRFCKERLDSILDMSVGVVGEEHIAIAALYHKKIFIIPRVDSLKRKQKSTDDLNFNSEKWVEAYGTSEEDPFFITYVRWSIARATLQDGSAIAITDFQDDTTGARHVDVVCKIEMPRYILEEQLKAIECAGYFLRSLCNVYIEEEQFSYALMLASKQMKPDFRYCCTPIYEYEFEEWQDKISNEYYDWIGSPENSNIIVDAFYNDEAHRSNLVYENDDPDEDIDHHHLKRNLYFNDIMMDEIEFPAWHEMWESVVVFSYIFKKNIFIVRGRDKITRYGSPSPPTFPTHVCKARWKHVIDDLEKNECLCFFTRGTSDKGDNDFDVTHVVLPSSSPSRCERKRKDTFGSTTEPSSLRSHQLHDTANSENDEDEEECMCQIERPNCSRNSFRVISLAEADEIMRFVCA